MKSKFLFLGIMSLVYIRSYSQIMMDIHSGVEKQTSINATPLAASFGIYGQVPVSNFTGTPEINIPLYNVAYRDLNVNLSLMYHQAIGNKPDLFPGYFGNGWLVTTGGIITRLSKGARPQENRAFLIGKDNNPTKDSTWSATSVLEEYVQEKTTVVDPNNVRYDEFSYNFGKFSGKFYTDFNDTLQLMTAQGEMLKIQIDVADSQTIALPYEDQNVNAVVRHPGMTYENRSGQRQWPYRFTVTDSRGIKYIFGGTAESIELSRPGMLQNSTLVNGDEDNVSPSSWYLTSIISPNGYKIELNYKRDHFYVTSVIGHWGRLRNFIGISVHEDEDPVALSIRSTLYNPCYLDSIKTPVSTTKFYWSKADRQLGYKFSAPVFTNDEIGHPHTVNTTSPYYFYEYQSVRHAYMDNRFPNKLDSFNVYTASGNKTNAVQFTYTDDTTTRLKLLSVRIKGGNSNNATASVYQFEYNSTPLPDYLSMKTDKYGFYNGRNYLSFIPANYEEDGDNSVYSDLFQNELQRDSFIQSKEPDSNYTKAEILEKVIYPTGGYTTYEYENNTCSKYISSWPASVTEYPSDSITGGLRIKKICNYDYLNHKAGETQYYYKTNFAAGGQRTSGVLNYKPEFYREYDSIYTHKPRSLSGGMPDSSLLVSYKEWSTNPINTQNYNEPNFINYSEVAEVNLDKSYTVYKYQNHDNGFLDKPAVNMVSDNVNVPSWKEDDENSLSLERGLIKSEMTYDSLNTCKTKAIYEYNKDTSRFNNHVRVLKAYTNYLYSNDYTSLRYVAYLYYTYYPYLKKRTQTEYTTAGDSIVTEMNYTYDDRERLLKTQATITSDGNTLLTEIRYPKDMIALGQTAPYEDMVDKNMTGIPVEQEKSAGGVFASKAVVNYAQNVSVNTALILPVLTKIQNRDGPLENRDNFYVYDTTGNPVYFGKEGDVRTCILWSYANSLPIIKIVNANYDSILAILGGQQEIEELGRQIPGDALVNYFGRLLRGSNALSHSLVTSYTYDLLTGLTSETGPDGKTVYYEYDDMNRLTIIRDNEKHIIKKICYNYSGQQENCTGNDKTFATVQLTKADNRSYFCGTPGLLGHVTAYYSISNIDDSLLFNYIPDSFYNNSELTSFITDGYYRLAPGNTLGGLPLLEDTYLYIKDGKVLYTGSCSVSPPYILKYSDSLLALTEICTADLPDVAVFTSSWSHLYANYPATVDVADGYYIRDNECLHVTGGVITQRDTCYTVDSFQVRIGSTRRNACLHFTPEDSTSTDTLFTVYYKNTGTIPGTVLYTDPAFTIHLSAGYYSDGDIVYTVNSSGVITDSMTCSEAIFGAIIQKPFVPQLLQQVQCKHADELCILRKRYDRKKTGIIKPGAYHRAISSNI